MSLDATRWAWSLTDVRSMEKLVLLSLADRADENHCCFPSIARMANDTGMNRKTVISCIQSLEDSRKLKAFREGGKSTKYSLIGVEDRHQTSTKNGTSKNGTSTKNGIGKLSTTSTKNGTHTSPKNGTDQSQKRDTNLPITYQVNLTVEDDAHVREKKFTDHHQWESFLADRNNYRRDKIITAKNIRMFQSWVKRKLTREEFEQAAAIAHAANNEQTPVAPGYYGWAVEDVISQRGNTGVTPVPNKHRKPSSQASLEKHNRAAAQEWLEKQEAGSGT